MMRRAREPNLRPIMRLRPLRIWLGYPAMASPDPESGTRSSGVRRLLSPEHQAALAGEVHPCPESIDLVDGPWGLRLVATRPLAAGEVLYRSGWCVIADAPHAIETTVLTGSGPRSVTITTTHSVRLDGSRVFDIPGCFMNHHCAPNTASRYCDDDDEAYEQFAIRAIASGEEITCNYVFFDWDCDGHAFDCACGAPECLGQIAGFGALPPDVQRRLAPMLSDESQRCWLDKEEGRPVGPAS